MRLKVIHFLFPSLMDSMMDLWVGMVGMEKRRGTDFLFGKSLSSMQFSFEESDHDPSFKCSFTNATVFICARGRAWVKWNEWNVPFFPLIHPRK
jgi:hypothetical protein